MTERLHDEQLDREIRTFLAWQAEKIAGAPSATEIATRISSRAGTRTAGLRLAPQLVWVVLAGLLIVALMVAVVIGAGLLRDDPVRSSAPSNGLIAYSTRAHGATTGVQGDIFLVREGSEPRLVAGGDGLLTVCPSFSPDGTQLSYVRDENVIILGIDRSEELRHEHGFGVASLVPGACPVWSPSSDAVAMLAAGEIALLGLDRSTRSLPVPDGAPVEFADTALAFAPDGKRIALATDVGIWLVPVDGSAPERVSTRQALSLSWSPDGARLAFHEEGNGATGLASVLTIGADAGVLVLGPGSRPVWSPAGEPIAYQSQGALVIERSDGSDRRVVSERDAYGFGGWSPDGRQLLQMVDISGSGWDLVSVAATGANDTVVARQIDTGSARNFPDLGDVSWQAVYQ